MKSALKTPPLLLGATLLFWGWQTGHYAAALVMALVLEGARLVNERWELSEEDFSRVWTFCAVLFLAAAVYAFTSNAGPSHFSSLFQDPRPSTTTAASRAGVAAVATLFRWLPMIFFLFVAAQFYSVRQEVPLNTISLILRLRWKRAVRDGRALSAGRGVDLFFPFFTLCLFSASYHTGETKGFFWGFCALLAWALWYHRSPRFSAPVWAGTFVLAGALGLVSQHGILQAQNYLGSMNPEWLFAGLIHRESDSPLLSRTSLGRAGRIRNSGRIVIRLKPERGAPPTYLREASYCIFDSTNSTWSVRNEQMEGVVQRPVNSGRWLLVPGKTNVAEVNIACYLDGRSDQTGEPTGLLPLPTGSGLLENLPAYTLEQNQWGAVLAEGPGLVIFDARYGPGATIDSPPNTDAGADLQVPAVEKPALDRVISQLNLRGENARETLRILKSYFQDNFRYSLWQPRPQGRFARRTPLSRFLLRTHSGHCEYFATATVLLLRELGVPARYAVGYAVHERSGGGYVVRERDAHAWCLVWNQQTRLWENFDTTPASWEQIEARRSSPWQWAQDLFSWIGFQFEMFRWGQSPLRSYLLFLLVPALGISLYRIFFRRGRRRRTRPADEPAAPRPGLDSEFYLVERKLVERGFPRGPHEPLSGWLARATREPALQPMKMPLDELLRLHYRCRFDPRGLDPANRAALKQRTAALLTSLEQSARGDAESAAGRNAN